MNLCFLCFYLPCPLSFDFKPARHSWITYDLKAACATIWRASPLILDAVAVFQTTLSMSADGPAAAELHSTLQQLAARMAADGHPIQAIKCYLAVLNQSMLPSEEAATRLKLSQLLLQHTLNVQDAKQHMQKAVRRRSGGVP